MGSFIHLAGPRFDLFSFSYVLNLSEILQGRLSFPTEEGLPYHVTKRTLKLFPDPHSTNLFII